ncbi:MAG: hypothetical protein PHN49_05375 [Candidatus Omnitrophica bacterium]|nr:hypothetical protein [Candidatus Omnitrophota bacterium]MDD5671047.1 hypothetical protein [Candidatus Omnitrophota bacterium]
MVDYLCPVCQKKMKRDLVVFLKHTDEHIVDMIKSKHPEWVSADGVCRKCSDYYRKQIKGESPST